MMKNDPIATGKNAKRPDANEPIELLAAVTIITQSVTTPARQARSLLVNATRVFAAPSARKRVPARIVSGNTTTLSNTALVAVQSTSRVKAAQTNQTR